MLVCSLVSTISTPGTTPPASLSEPRNPPWNPCPAASGGDARTSSAPKTSEARTPIHAPFRYARRVRHPVEPPTRPEGQPTRPRDPTSDEAVSLKRYEGPVDGDSRRSLTLPQQRVEKILRALIVVLCE